VGVAGSCRTLHEVWTKPRAAVAQRFLPDDCQRATIFLLATQFTLQIHHMSCSAGAAELQHGSIWQANAQKIVMV